MCSPLAVTSHPASLWRLCPAWAGWPVQGNLAGRTGQWHLTAAMDALASLLNSSQPYEGIWTGSFAVTLTQDAVKMFRK